MIDRATVNKIMDAANIVDVVSDFVTLKRAGANLKGLCPFHDDRTPSFMVSPAKNLCKCFACGEGGSPLNFIMKHEQLSYPDALRYLARKYGIPIEEKEVTAEEMQSRNDRESMFIVNEWARDWFIQQLYDTPDGRAIGLAYFRGRGFRDDIIKKFQVGYCPNSRDHSLAQDALKAGYEERFLINTPDEKEPKNSIGTGLCLKNDKGQLRDRFYDRVMWPIFTISGRVAGFGGRVLDARTHGVAVKYQNSPESIVYSKRKELFGLFQAKQAIRKQDLCFLVEGYTDVMAMHQNGLENVVASSGTALTFDQIRLIKRLTNNMTLIFDGDEAGIHAALRGTDMLLSEGMNVKLLLLPDNDDPDSFGRKHNATEYQEYMATHQVDFIQYKTELLMKEAQNDPSKQGRVAENIVESIAAIPDEITRSFYVRQAARALNLEERMIQKATVSEVGKRLEEKRREREREEHRQAMGGYEIPADNGPQPQLDETPAQTPQQQQPQPQPAKAQQGNPHEGLLTQMIVRNGEVIVCNMEDEDGQKQPISLAEYIYLNLKADELELQTPEYARMLQEALDHVGEPDFKAERYFNNHPDPKISHIAFLMTMDQEELSRFYDEHKVGEEKSLPTELLEGANQLLAELKLDICRKEIRQIMDTCKTTKDREQYRALMTRFAELKKVERELAKECGSRVVNTF